MGKTKQKAFDVHVVFCGVTADDADLAAEAVKKQLRQAMAAQPTPIAPWAVDKTEEV